MTFVKKACLAGAIVLSATGAFAQNNTRAGILSCDVSRGIGLFVVEKQTLVCTFTSEQGGRIDNYTGTIDQYGVTLGAVKAGHLVWAVLAATTGVAKGELAGSYTGVGANASVGVGAGVNVLAGANERALSLQPLSVEGQAGINIAGGVTRVTLVSAD